MNLGSVEHANWSGPQGADLSRRGPGVRRWWVAVGALVLAAYVYLFLTTAWGAFIRPPYWDAYDILAVEFEAQDRGDPGLYLWHQHGGHHIVWLRLLTAIDVRVFHGRSVVFAVAALIALLATCFMLSREIWRGVDDKRLAWPFSAVPPLALLTSFNAFDVGAPLNTPYLHTLVFAAAAFILAERGAGSLRTLLGLLVLASGAAMSNSVGLAVVPVLMIAVWRRPERGRLALMWMAGPLLVAAFLATTGPLAHEASAPAQGPAERALRAVRYFFSFSGLPWSASSQKMSAPGGLGGVLPIAGPAIGLLLVSLGLFLAARPARGADARSRLDRLCCSLVLFSVAAAGMAALGRSNATAELQIPVRYSVILAPLHIGVAVLLLTRSAGQIRWTRTALASAFIAASVLAIGQQAVGRYVILRHCAHLRQVMAAFNAGQRTPEMAQYVYPDLRRAEAVTAEIRRRGLYR